MVRNVENNKQRIGVRQAGPGTQGTGRSAGRPQHAQPSSGCSTTRAVGG